MSERSGASRVARTRVTVLDAVRGLVAERGMSGLTYVAVAEASGVSRQTLYNHWPTRESFVIDLLGDDGARNPPICADVDVRATVAGRLSALADRLSDPARAAAMLALAGAAAHEPAARAALNALLDVERASLSALLPASSPALDRERYADIVGPLVFRMLFTGTPPTADEVGRLAASVVGVSD